MQQEIFGPVLPVLTYDSLGGAVTKINSMAHPLALYIFTEDEKNARKLLPDGFGGGCINDVLIHLATSNMGFGGFGESGMGSYHGIDGFRTFSHYKSIVDKRPGSIFLCGIRNIGRFMRKWYGCLCVRYKGRALPDASPSCYFRFSYYFPR